MLALAGPRVVRSFLVLACALGASGCGEGSEPAPAGDGASAPAAGRAAAGSPERIQIDTSDAAQRELWSSARARLGACEPVGVDIIYSFGTARLEADRQPAGCRLRVFTRGELGETDDWDHTYSCSSRILELDWLPANATDPVRESPLDEELGQNPECQTV